MEVYLPPACSSNWRSAPSSPSGGWYRGLRHHRHGSTHGIAGSHGNLVGLNISFDPNTERRLWGLYKKMCVSKHDSSSSICQSVSMVPEPVGHSTRNPTLCQRASNPRAPSLLTLGEIWSPTIPRLVVSLGLVQPVPLRIGHGSLSSAGSSAAGACGDVART